MFVRALMRKRLHSLAALTYTRINNGGIGSVTPLLSAWRFERGAVA